MSEGRKTRSPIKNLPVRAPGQSLGGRVRDLVVDRLLFHSSIALMLLMGAAMCWAGYAAHTRLVPTTVTLAALVSLAIAIVKGRSAWRELPGLKLGWLGEEAVGQFLDEKLRPLGFQVLHDVPGSKFNVDHVVIGAPGIYTVETKTHSKPAKGTASIVFDGEQVTVDGFSPDRDPVAQAKAQARWLLDTIEETTGKRFAVQPVVLYPGWFIETKVQWPDVWVMNEKLFLATIQKLQPRLPDPDVHLVTYHLKRYVIAKTKEQAQKA